MSAASIAHRPSVKARKVEEPVARTPAYSIERVNKVVRENAERDLYNALPPQSQIIQDKNKSDILRAATISMQRKPNPIADSPISPTAAFYSHLPTTPKQVSAIEAAQSNNRNSMRAATLAAANDTRQVQPEKPKPRPFYPHLEEAARKAAAARLAQLEQDHQNARNGIYSSNSIRHRQSTDTDLARSAQIQAEVAGLQRRVVEVDKQKQVRDSLALMAAAERNVKKQMEAQDDKIAEDQGRVPKHVQAEWDSKAKAMSEQYEKTRQAEVEAHKGKINIGGGKWIAQEDVDRIARGNVQPILDEINAKAAAERARQEEIRLEREETERVRRVANEREADMKAEKKRVRGMYLFQPNTKGYG